MHSLHLNYNDNNTEEQYCFSCGVNSTSFLYLRRFVWNQVLKPNILKQIHCKICVTVITVILFLVQRVQSNS